jgi:EmrB/QacA subfamily drug resistance transporter
MWSLETQAISQPTHVAHESVTQRWLMLAVILGAAFMAVLDGFIVNIAMPSIALELHTGIAELQLVVAGYTLAYAVLLITGGRLGDLYGRKRLSVLGVGGFTLFSALCGVAPNAFLLIVFRIAQGAAAALMTPQVLSFIQLNFDAQERRFAFGAYASVAGVASILGQVFGGALLAANLLDLGWRSIFLVNVPIGVGVLLLAAPFLRESRLEEKPSPDYWGVVLLTVSLFLLIFPLVQGASTGWPLWAQLCLLLSLPCILAFLTYEQRMVKAGRTPLVAPALFQQVRFTTGMLTVTLGSALIAALLFLLAFYLQSVLRLTPLQAGLVFMASSIAFILASSLSPVIARPLAHRTMSVAAALVSLGYLLTLLAVQVFVPLWGLPPLLVALFVVGFGMGLLGTSLMHATLAGVAQPDIGTASGSYTTAQQTAAALGVALIGLVFTVFWSEQWQPALRRHRFAVGDHAA